MIFGMRNMQRTIEPELMEDEVQTKAYSEADFEQQHSKIIHLLDELFEGIDISGEILDLGCGPGDVTFRIARRFPKANITAIDGSKAMLRLAEERKNTENGLKQRVDFIQAMVPSANIPRKAYDLIISSSFLHHLHQPEVLWQTIKQHSKPGTKVFITDLSRPEDKNIANSIVNEGARNEPDILKHDYFNSLLAAFTPEEVKAQLIKANLNQLTIHIDRYIIVYGCMS